MSLAESVLAAANHLENGGQEGDTVVEDQEVPVEGIEEETPVEDAEEEETTDELDEASLEEAKKLYKALKDPNQATAVVSALAGQMGLLRNPPETKAEVKEAKKDVKEILKLAVGTEYAFLSDRIGNALDQIFDQERNERQAEIQQLSNAQVERDSLAAMNALRTETKGESQKFEAKMIEISKKILPSPGMSIKEYLNILYTVATAGKQTGIVKSQLNDKIRRNANDVTSRLRSGGSVKDEVGFDPNKKYSLKQSVALAARQLELNNVKGNK